MYENVIILEWNKWSHKHTLTLDKQVTNVVEIQSAPSYEGYSTFWQEAHILTEPAQEDKMGPEFSLL